MLQTVRDACKFDQKAVDYALSEQIEKLDDLINHKPGDAEAFFRKTYVTGGMKTLLRQGLQRLSGASGQAVFELKQAMGGGKTHSMLALGYLAANPSLASLTPSEITSGFKPVQANIVAASGRSISRDKHLWGDIAEQPTLILLDELPPYFGYAVTQAVGGGTLAEVATYALSNLLSAAAERQPARWGARDAGGTATGIVPEKFHQSSRSPSRRGASHPRGASSCPGLRREGGGCHWS
jgi:hypothetical protein